MNVLLLQVFPGFCENALGTCLCVSCILMYWY